MDEETRPTKPKRGGRPLGAPYPHRQHINMGSLDQALAERLADLHRTTVAGVLRRGVMEQAKEAGLTAEDVAVRVRELDEEAERVMDARRSKYRERTDGTND